MNDLIILGMLLAGPKHGYRLKQDSALFSGAGPMHNNTIYPLLKKYLEQGWIDQQEAQGERGQTRLLYLLTAAGKQVLAEKLAAVSQADAASEQAFWIRVGLFDCLGKADRERILGLRDDYLRERLEMMRPMAESPRLVGWSATTFRFVQAQLTLERKWIAKLKLQIDGGSQ